MPETSNGGNSPAQPPKEISMEKRLLLAFLIMGGIMFVTPYLFKSVAPPVKKQTPTEQTAPATPANNPPAAAEQKAEPKEAETEAAAPTVPAIREQALPPLTIDTTLFRVTLSNQGGTVRSWLLKKYYATNGGKLLDLVNNASGLDFPFSLYFPGQKPTVDVNKAAYRQSVEPDGLGVTYEFSDGHTSVRKTFRFERNSYLSHVSAEVSIDGKPVPSMIEWRGGFGDLTVNNPSAPEYTLYYNLTDNKLAVQNARSAKNGPVTANGNYSFAGIADTYFAAVFLPQGGDSVQMTTFADNVRTPGDQNKANFTGVALSDGSANHFELFTGPKDLDLLKRVNPKLEQVVDFGWLSFMARPLFLLVNWFNTALVHNFGWAIIVATVAINMALFPLKLSNMKSMRKMSALKPQIDTINAKYKNISIRDPRKSEQNQEIMDLYKKHGVNPMGGCFPMLIQIPFFFAFYKVFTVSVDMRGAGWLWVTDLSQPEHIAIHILPIIMIAAQFWMQKMTPQPNTDRNQQMMMLFMPLIFGFMFYNLPSGLVLYYLTSTLVGMGQQWFFNHTDAAQAAARSVEPPPKKKSGRK